MAPFAPSSTAAATTAPHTDFLSSSSTTTNSNNTPPDRDLVAGPPHTQLHANAHAYSHPPSHGPGYAAHYKSMSRSARKSHQHQHQHQQRFSGEFRSTSNGLEGSSGRPIPQGPQAQQHQQSQNAGPGRGGGTGQIPNGPAGFEGSRSPPNAKNTSHVPCKFFKIGQCQAGQACPFSHATDASAYEQPCKYFSRGNCKFGHKCALLHVLPNGRIVNRPNASLGHLNIGNRVEPTPYLPESVLGNSLAQQPPPSSSMGPLFGHQLPPDMDLGYHSSPALQPYDIPQPTSHPHHLATPRDDLRIPMSPPMHLTALDAPLPASFDSQGISYMARHGPVAASVPSKFGFDSPPHSLPQKSGAPLDTLRHLHESAYYGRSSGGSNSDTKQLHAALGSSPSGPELALPRIMHSQRVSRPKMMSSSLPRPNLTDEWETDELLFGGEEDYIPGNLSHLLNAEERTRRHSGRVEDPQALRDTLGVGAGEFSRKVGSPSTASPSRFADFFNKQREEQNGSSGAGSGPSFVGSPMGRLGSSPGMYGAPGSMRAGPRSSAEVATGFAVSSPPRNSATSMLSQQLQRTRISGDGSGRTEGGGLNPVSGSGARRGGVDRAVSSNSVNTNRIEEEQPDFLFALDDIGHTNKQQQSQQSQQQTTHSPWQVATPKSSHLGSIGDGRRSLDRDEGKVKK